MAKKRTKHQKKKAEEKRQTTTYSLQEIGRSSAVKKQRKTGNKKTEQYAQIAVEYLKKDLLHSLLISSCIAFVLFGFYFYLR